MIYNFLFFGSYLFYQKFVFVVALLFLIVSRCSSLDLTFSFNNILLSNFSANPVITAISWSRRQNPDEAKLNKRKLLVALKVLRTILLNNT